VLSPLYPVSYGVPELKGEGGVYFKQQNRVESISRDILHGIQRGSTGRQRAKGYKTLDGSEDYILEDASPFVLFQLPSFLSL